MRRWLCLSWQRLLGFKKKRHQILVLTAGRSDDDETLSLSVFLFSLRSHGSAWLFTKPKRRISRCWRAQRGSSWPPIVSVRSRKTGLIVLLFLTGCDRLFSFHPTKEEKLTLFLFVSFLDLVAQNKCKNMSTLLTNTYSSERCRLPISPSGLGSLPVVVSDEQSHTGCVS